MSHLPPLPQSVSRDGSELWDWAAKASHAIQRQARISELEADIRKCGTQCGDCFKWMKSSECPRERPGEGKRSGYSVGPSMSGPICTQYQESRSATERRAALKAELQAITQ